MNNRRLKSGIFALLILFLITILTTVSVKKTKKDTKFRIHIPLDSAFGKKVIHDHYYYTSYRISRNEQLQKVIYTECREIYVHVLVTTDTVIIENLDSNNSGVISQPILGKPVGVSGSDQSILLVSTSNGGTIIGLSKFAIKQLTSTDPNNEFMIVTSDPKAPALLLTKFHTCIELDKVLGLNQK